MKALRPVTTFALFILASTGFVLVGALYQPQHMYCNTEHCLKLDVPRNYRSLTKAEYKKAAKQIAEFFGVDAALVIAMITVESNFDPIAVSSKGAKGLMQINDITAKELGLKDEMHPIENIIAGVKYIKTLEKRFNGDLDLTLAAYNAGPTLVSSIGKVPDYQETKDYITKVKSELEQL